MTPEALFTDEEFRQRMRERAREINAKLEELRRQRDEDAICKCPKFCIWHTVIN